MTPRFDRRRGPALRAHGRADEATTALARARTMFEELGAVADLATAAELLND